MGLLSWFQSVVETSGNICSACSSGVDGHPAVTARSAERLNL